MHGHQRFCASCVTQIEQQADALCAAAASIWFCIFTTDTLHVPFGQYIDVIFLTMALYPNVLVILIKQLYLIFFAFSHIVRIVRYYILPS